ncbi:hypothetical protein [Desulfomonile tiedjei]|uniref:Uncharacterized protein n=1 Tax=Desulfomonile tiedjei (strain ATCC 49306 / DSM 6799 / DCB-1) TaxID=706587 RepID=I4C5Z6_DESTA|nr:hypothetical protein [Desulfomonile tiedjei]AFM24987.1 hypothetical protein Desti_2299 [Desulfomonile tiedjei DSM 6799]
MAKSYSAQDKKSTSETTYQQGTGQPATLAETSPLTDQLSTDDDIEITFADETNPSLDDPTCSDSVSLTMDTDKPLTLDDPDDDITTLDHEPRDVPDDENDPDISIEWNDESFPWPTAKPLSELELAVWKTYHIPLPILPETGLPPLNHLIAPLTEWAGPVKALIATATDLNLESIDSDDLEAGKRAERAFCTLKAVERLFSDLDVLFDVWGKALHKR